MNYKTQLEKEIEYAKIKGGIIKPKGRPRKKDIRYSDEQYINLNGRKGIAYFDILIARAKLEGYNQARKEDIKVFNKLIDKTISKYQEWKKREEGQPCCNEICEAGFLKLMDGLKQRIKELKDGK